MSDTQTPGRRDDATGPPCRRGRGSIGVQRAEPGRPGRQGQSGVNPDLTVPGRPRPLGHLPCRPKGVEMCPPGIPNRFSTPLPLSFLCLRHSGVSGRDPDQGVCGRVGERDRVLGGRGNRLVLLLLCLLLRSLGLHLRLLLRTPPADQPPEEEGRQCTTRVPTPVPAQPPKPRGPDFVRVCGSETPEEKEVDEGEGSPSPL